MTTDRWVCRRCGANNMPQMTACFQCHQPFQAATPPSPTRPSRTSTVPAFLIAAVIAVPLLVCGIGSAVVVSALRSSSPPPATNANSVPGEPRLAGKIYWTRDAFDFLQGEFVNLSGVPIQDVEIRARVSVPRSRSGFALPSDEKIVRCQVEDVVGTKTEEFPDGGIMQSAETSPIIPPNKPVVFHLFGARQSNILETRVFTKQGGIEREIPFTAEIRPQ